MRAATVSFVVYAKFPRIRKFSVYLISVLLRERERAKKDFSLAVEMTVGFPLRTWRFAGDTLALAAALPRRQSSTK